MNLKCGLTREKPSTRHFRPHLLYATISSSVLAVITSNTLLSVPPRMQPPTMMHASNNVVEVEDGSGGASKADVDTIKEAEAKFLVGEVKDADADANLDTIKEAEDKFLVVEVKDADADADLDTIKQAEAKFLVVQVKDADADTDLDTIKQTEAKFPVVQVKDADADAADGLCSKLKKYFSNWRNQLVLPIVDYNDLSRKSTRT
jgi:hypothetical protein